MAQIGHFTRDKSGFTGRIQTLFFTHDLSLVPAESSDAENAPDFRVHLGDADGPEIGAGWKRTGETSSSGFIGACESTVSSARPGAMCSPARVSTCPSSAGWSIEASTTS
ncbi:DUF736 domain-containing protein [Methylocella sp.]|uniref:DUF736 domain-containing protein n=1 Tax=Methylocella sp. TaxID=1978226 RepID=UPI003784CA6B